MSRKNKRKNIIDVPEARRFLFKAYGLKSREITNYELEIFHEEFRGIFEWYHTTGVLLCRMKKEVHGETEIDYKQFGKVYEEEAVAVRIIKFVYESIEKDSSLYWDKTARSVHKESLQAIYKKIENGRTETEYNYSRE